MNAEMRIAELEERIHRLQIVLRAVSGRANNWQLPSVGEYYRNGMKAAYADVQYTIDAGLRWALDGDGHEPE